MKTEKARIDTDGKAKPLTRLVGHHDPAYCFYGTTKDLQIETVATGERTDCAPPPPTLVPNAESVFTPQEQSLLTRALDMLAQQHPEEHDAAVMLAFKLGMMCRTRKGKRHGAF